MTSDELPPHILLVVEDDPDVREVLREALKSPAGVILMKDTLQGARETLRLVVPDAVILDISLPDGNGLELLHDMEQNDRLSGVPVYILSGNNSLSTRVSGYVAGARRYFIKPVDMDMLVECVRTAQWRTQRRHGHIVPA